MRSAWRKDGADAYEVVTESLRDGRWVEAWRMKMLRIVPQASAGGTRGRSVRRGYSASMDPARCERGIITPI